MREKIPPEVIGKLREALVRLNKSDEYGAIVESRDAVLARFQPVFNPAYIPDITEGEFRAFLLEENNRHWSGLHRHGTRVCSNMKKLRQALLILVDEERPIAERLTQANDMVSGMGKNIATAILLIAFPTRYGVWNSTSEAALIGLGIWPKFERGESFGSRYVKVNEVLEEIGEKLKIDFWTLDALWWFLDERDISSELMEEELSEDEAQRFGLESHLHDFIRDNWNKLALGREWQIHEEPGDEYAGYKYPCEVGQIDLLAKHKTKPRWLVIELKRNKPSDSVVGQLCRYMGWVKKNLAEHSEEVHGLIICYEADDKLNYAVSVIPDTELMVYQVDFQLKKAE